MLYEVTWDQWFRCGPDGDDSDYTQESISFDTLERATKFKADLISGKFRGFADMRVHENEVTITRKEESNQ